MNLREQLNRGNKLAAHLFINPLMSSARLCYVVLLLLFSIVNFANFAIALTVGGGCTSSERHRTRRELIVKSCPTLLTLSSFLASPASAAAAESKAEVAAALGLAERLSMRDASYLTNSIFNAPPRTQVHPQFMRGCWDITETFKGYVFPSKKVDKNKIVGNLNVPGFQKCSIANIGDIGAGGEKGVAYRKCIDEVTGMEDRRVGVASSIDAHLGYKAVEKVEYDGDRAGGNPNRMSVKMLEMLTRNAERIELFYNARESETVESPKDPNLKIFVCSEHCRQVTFSLSKEFGIAREVVGNYASYYTWRECADGNTITGNVLTAGYLDPQDAMYFNEPRKPVVVYSHELLGKKLLDHLG